MSRDRQRYRSAQLRQEEQRLLATARPIPQRITTALDMAGLYGPEVDRALGVEEPAVDLWEAGELEPTPDQLRALADMTGYPVRFFFLEVPEPAGPAWMCGSDGCERIEPSTRPREPVADVLWLPSTDRLF